MNKQEFYTYHKSYSGHILAYYSGNQVRYTAKQFTELKGVVLTLNGVDYKINKDTVNKIEL